MSAWSDRVRSHAVWQQLEALGPSIDEGLRREGISPTAVENLNRLKAVVSYVGRRLGSSDSQLLPQHVLDGLSSNLQSAVTEVRNFVANGNEGHLANANANADGVIKNAAQIIATPVDLDLSDLRNLADSYRDTLEKNLRTVHGATLQNEAELGALREKLAVLASEIASEKQRLSQLATDHQSQFSSAQDSRSKEFSDAQTARQEKFAAAVGEYSQKLTEQNLEFGRQRDQLVQNCNDDLLALSAKYQAAAEGVLATIREHLAQVEKLVGVIGNLGVTSGYQTTANEARNTARVWQFIAVSALLAIITIAYKAFVPIVLGGFSWEGFAARVFVTLTVGVLAAYAISQADKYQQVERRARKLALELEALGPFLASLNPEKQEEFRLRIGDRSFGTSDDLIDRHSSDSPKSVLDVAISKDLRMLIAEVIKAVKKDGS